MILYNKENNLMTRAALAAEFGVDAVVLDTIIKGRSYKDYKLEYDTMAQEDREKIVSLFSNK